MGAIVRELTHKDKFSLAEPAREVLINPGVDGLLTKMVQIKAWIGAKGSKRFSSRSHLQY